MRELLHLDPGGNRCVIEPEGKRLDVMKKADIWNDIHSMNRYRPYPYGMTVEICALEDGRTAVSTFKVNETQFIRQTTAQVDINSWAS